MKKDVNREDIPPGVTTEEKANVIEAIKAVKPNVPQVKIGIKSTKTINPGSTSTRQTQPQIKVFSNPKPPTLPQTYGKAQLPPITKTNKP